jgi:hypothetical protein
MVLILSPLRFFFVLDNGLLHFTPNLSDFVDGFSAIFYQPNYVIAVVAFCWADEHLSNKRLQSRDCFILPRRWSGIVPRIAPAWLAILLIGRQAACLSAK